MNKYLPLNLQFFADEEGDADQGESGGQEQQEQTEEQGTDSQQSEENTFTQDDVNNVVAKETKKIKEKMLKDLGVDSFKNAKEGMDQFKQWQEQQKTDAEKQQEQLDNITNEKESLSQENEKLQAQLSAFNKGVKPDSAEDVVTLAKNLVDDDTDIEAAIDKVIEKYPHFSGEQQEEEESKPSFTTGQHKKGDGPTSDFAKTLLGG